MQLRERASLRSRGIVYTVAQNASGRWYFVCAKDGEVERFPLDHDTRHARFFLTEEDQRYVGIDGLKALEKLARMVLTR